MRKYIPHYRVCTLKQGQAGLALDAQRAAVHSFAASEGQLGAEFVEVESGKKNEPPAPAGGRHGRGPKGRGTLLIARLDRLSRNAGFIFALRDSGLDFVCCDMPDGNTLTVGLFAIMAQHERETISKRTTDALQAKKARGARLGTPANLTAEAVAKGREVRQQNVRTHQANRQAARLASLLQARGHTLQQIAQGLNESGYRYPSREAILSHVRAATASTRGQLSTFAAWDTIPTPPRIICLG
ncbi:recombinase family protein [Hymenobacter sp. UYP22]|uniref:recombinase family protein n=1 Tax=Hymenobacter sp. UYP22 TaxID=3156348 RepID=UPI003395FCA5